MTTIEWKDSFNVNIETIDSQHKILIRVFNDLGNAMEEGKGKEVVKDTLNRLVDYTQFHFSAEEELMAQYEYPEYGPHKRAHDDLKKKVIALNERRNDEGFVLRLEIIYFLKNWLQSHILETDKRLGAWLNRQMKEGI